MEVVFLKLLNLSITAGWFVLAVVLLRLILKKAPKWVFCLLWGLVGIRLVLPFSLETVFSLIPSAETVPETIAYAQTPVIDSGVGIVDQAVNPVIAESLVPTVETSVNPIQVITSAASIIWIVGMIILLLYLTVSYLRLRNRVRMATRLEGNIRQSENVAAPFILGLFKPGIYLPYHLSKSDFENVVAHEDAHLKRRDHLIKPMAFLILTVYWFNPLMWLAYILLCRDIELACDEKVIGKMNEDQRKSYSTALLNCNVNRHVMAACPLAFGEVGVKERVMHVKAYKKPAFWIIAVAIIACIVISVCFLTNPIGLKFDFGSNSIIAASSHDGRENSPGPYLRDFTEAQIDELVSRLEGISGARLSEEYGGLTPFYAISAKLADGTWIQICGYGIEADMTDIICNEKRYMITDTDFAAYVSDVCAGKDTEQAVEITDDIESTPPADGDGLPLILSFEDYSSIYVYEAVKKEYEDLGKSFRDVVSQYNWQVTGTECGGLENDPEAVIMLTRGDGMQLYIWDDADVILCTENDGTTISCGKTIINELMPWAKAQYAKMLASVPSVSTEDIPGLITALPTFNWSAYITVNGEQAGGDLIDALYTYVADHELNRTQYSLVMQGTIGLDGAYAEGYVDIIDILMERDPYTLIWCYDRLPAEKQVAVLPYIVYAYKPASSQETVLAWMDDVREQLSIAEEIPLSTDTGGETEFAIDMGGGVTLGLTTYRGGLPISLSGFHGYRYEDTDGRNHIEAGCQSLGIVIRAGISSTADYSPWEIGVNTPAYPTVSGVAVGDGEEDIIAAYVANLQRIEGESNNKSNGHYDLRYVYAPEGDAKITFYLYEGAIYLIVMERELG